ncbi:MAG: hypothetical protein ACP5M7_10470, partial [Thermoproteota archaeon]
TEYPILYNFLPKTYAGATYTAEYLTPLWSLPSSFPTPGQAKVTNNYVVIWNASSNFNDVSSDEQYLSVTSKSYAVVLDLATGNVLANVTGEGVFALSSMQKVLNYSGKFSPNGKRLYCVNYKGYETSWTGTRNFVIDLPTMQSYTVDVSQFMNLAYSGEDFTFGVMDYTGDHFVSIYFGGALTNAFYYRYWELNYTTNSYSYKGNFDGDYWQGAEELQRHVLSPDGTTFVRYSVRSNEVAFYRYNATSNTSNMFFYRWSKTVSGFPNTSEILADTTGFQIIAFMRGSLITIGTYDTQSNTFTTFFNQSFSPSDFGYSSGSISWSYPKTYYDWWNPSGRPTTLAFISAPIAIGGVNYYPAVVYVDGTIFKVN